MSRNRAIESIDVNVNGPDRFNIIQLKNPGERSMLQSGPTLCHERAM